MTTHTTISPEETTDRVAIRELIDAYAHFADRRQPDDQAALYAEDGRTLVYTADPSSSEPVQVLTGRTEHAEGFKSLNAYVATMHFNGQATIDIDGATTATPGQFRAALTDFGPGRQQLFGNSADEYLTVYDRGPTSADVKEGSGGVWERLHYDWSDPNRIVMTTTDSKPDTWTQYSACGQRQHHRTHARTRRDTGWSSRHGRGHDQTARLPARRAAHDNPSSGPSSAGPRGFPRSKGGVPWTCD